jgi:hypothetical protein
MRIINNTKTHRGIFMRSSYLISIAIILFFTLEISNSGAATILNSATQKDTSHREDEEQKLFFELLEKQEKEKALEREKIKRETEKKYRKWGKRVVQAIKDGKIFIGMTKEQVRASWGPPDRSNRSVGSWGVHEQWIYGDFGPYLYFENNKLSSWQD